jgi:predicted permease
MSALTRATAAAAMTSILASASIISLGALARRWSLLSDPTSKQLSALQSTLLEPLLAFSSLCSLTTDDLYASGPFLMWPLVHAVIGLCLASLLLPRSPRRGAALVCATFGNAGALPTALIPTLLSGGGVAQAMLFVQVYLATWRLLLWSLAPALLASSRPQKRDDDGPSTPTTESLGQRLLRLLLPPPSVGSICGLSLAFAPTLVRALLLDGPLKFALSAAKLAGGAGPPLVLINLGYALSGVGGGGGGSGDSGGGGGGGGGAGALGRGAAFTAYEVGVVAVVKLLLLPGVHLILSAIVHPIEPGEIRRDRDPFHLVLLLQACMPAAVSVQAIFHREGVDTRPLGPMMLTQYALAAPTIVAIIVLAASL